MKGLSLHKIHNEELNVLLFNTIGRNIDNFSIRQLELLLWSVSRKHLAHHPEARLKDWDVYQRETLTLLADKVKDKAASMRPRGVAFAIESLANLGMDDQTLFNRLERVTLAKIDEFIPHYLVKILTAFTKAGHGSSELYD